MFSWYDIDGNTIADLRATPGFPEQPQETQLMATLEAPRDRADRYGTKLSSFLVPEQSGQYRFWIASDDAGELWLSSDAAIDNAVRIAYVDGWTPYRAYRHTPSQMSEPVALRAGRAYAVEALMKEGGGGDHLSIAWSTDGGEPTPIPERMLFVQVPPQPAPDAGLPALDGGAMADAGVTRDGTLIDVSVATDAGEQSDAVIHLDGQTDTAVDPDADFEADDMSGQDSNIEEDSSTKPLDSNGSSSGCACTNAGQHSFPTTFGFVMLVILGLRMRTSAHR